MNIGFFGDSYVDLNLDFHKQFPDYDESRIWALRLCLDMELTPVSSGVSGTNQYHAIKSWQDYISQHSGPNVAIFTFTWDHRLYSPHKRWQDIFSLTVEKKDLANLMVVPDDIDDIRKGVELYYKYLYNSDQSAFVHEQLIRWCLELPEQYPETKFIFLPNTEQSRELATKHFKTGVLLDFAFETISAIEGERVGIDLFDPEKFGHLTEKNHIRIKDIVKKIVLDYEKYRNQIYPINYEDFKL